MLPADGLSFEPGHLRALVRLEGFAPDRAKLGCVAWSGSEAWYSLSPLPASTTGDDAALASLPLNSPAPAAFNADPAAPLDWAEATRIWVGVVVDGEGDGSLTLAEPVISAEPFVASEPLTVVEPGEPRVWQVGADPQVWHDTETAEGPDGGEAFAVSFRFPIGAHMYLTPAIEVPKSLDGYRALRLVYRAELPEGIDGLLVLLTEGPAQFEAPPPPATGDDWAEVTIDLADFALGLWSDDDDGILDLSEVDRVIVGVHGTADGESGEGAIRVSRVEFVP
jgi:hypothetical protein